MLKGVNNVEVQSINTTNLQFDNINKNFDDFKAVMTNFVENSLNKEKEIISNIHSYEDKHIEHEKCISNLKNAINNLKKSYSNKKYDDTAKLRAIKNEDIKGKISDLDNALDEVYNMVENDKTLSKDELKEVDNLVKEIPKVVEKDSKVVNKAKKLSEIVEKKELAIDNNDLFIENNKNIEVVNIESNTEVDKEVDKEVNTEVVMDEYIASIENILVSMKELLDNNQITEEQFKEVVDLMLKGDNGANLLIIMNTIGNSNEKLKDTINIINKLFAENGINLDKVNMSDLEGLDVKELLSKIVESEGNSEFSNLVKQISSVLTKENFQGNQVQNQVNNLQVNDETSSLSSNLGNQSLNNDSNSNGSEFSKEEKVLDSIIKGKQNNVVNKFTVIANNFNSNTVAVTTTVVKESTMVADIIQNIKFMSTKGMDELIVKVNPRELGELVIKIIKDGDIMKAEINASSKETYALLLKNSDDIKKYLGEQNLKVQNIEIGLSDEGETGNSLFNESGSNKQNQSLNSREIDDNFVAEIEEDEEDEVLGLNMLV